MEFTDNNMGFLRKVGRKVKRGMNKLFGSKFGKIIGGIGLAMMFYTGASAMFGNTKWFQAMKTNISKMNPFAAKDVTTAVGTVTETATAVEAGAGTAAAIDGSAAIAGETVTSAGTISAKEAIKNDALAGLKSSTQVGLEAGIEGSKSFSYQGLNESAFADLNPAQKLAKVGVETVDFLKPSGDIIPDVTKGTLTGLTLNALQGEQEMNTGGFGQVAQRAPDAAPVDAYMSKINTDMPNLQATNFQQLSQNLMFGTLSPQFITQYG